MVTADFIRETGASRLKESLAYTPGINTLPWGADTRFDWTIIRGFDAQAPGYYLDGLQLRNNNSWAVWQTEVYGAERIEVLRGPTSVSYTHLRWPRNSPPAPAPAPIPIRAPSSSTPSRA